MLVLYFGLDPKTETSSEGMNQEGGLNCETIAERFGVTPQRIRQIKEKSIRRLRHSSLSKNLKDFL